MGTLTALSIASLLFGASSARADENDDDPGLVDLSGVWRYHAGDDARWSAPGLVDAAWERRAVPVTTYTPSSGPLLAWYRRTVVVPSHLRERALYMAVGSKRLCSIEVYAGGRHVGGKGSGPPSFHVPASGHALLRVPRGSWDADGRLPIAMRVWWLPSFGEALRPRFLDGLDLPPVLGVRAATLRYVHSPTPGAQTEWALALALTLVLVGAGVYQLVVSRSGSRSFAPDECAREVAELFAPTAAEKGVRLVLEIDPQIPRVRGAASRLRQVLLNLLGNAVKFTDRGEVVIRLTAQPRAEGAIELRFEVRDTGIGIAPEDFARLFQPFSQVAASSTRQHGGTGLGLVISKWLVERMGGRIDLRSEAGVGSVFSFFVVVCEEKGAATEPVSAPITAPPRSLRVLLVEDSLINQKVATLLLRNLDQRVALASDGQLAIDCVKRERFDVVLMDVQMPGMDGLEATRRIRADLPESHQPYIVALTASAMEEDRRRCLEAGMDDFLSKPIALGELAAALSRASACRVLATRSRSDALRSDAELPPSI